MSSSISTSTLHSITMPNPPSYEVLKLQWQIKELRRMLRTAENSLASMTDPRPNFLEPLTVAPVIPPTALIGLARAPANHIMIDGEWVHQDSERAQAFISSSTPSQPPAPAEIPAPSPPPSDTSSDSSSTRKKRHTSWNKVTMTLVPEDTIYQITKDIGEGRISPHQSSVSWTSKKHFPGGVVNQYILNCFRRFEDRVLGFETLKDLVDMDGDQHKLIKDGDTSELKSHLRELVNQGIIRI